MAKEKKATGDSSKKRTRKTPVAAAEAILARTVKDKIADDLIMEGIADLKARRN